MLSKTRSTYILKINNNTINLTAIKRIDKMIPKRIREHQEIRHFSVPLLCRKPKPDDFIAELTLQGFEIPRRERSIFLGCCSH